MSLLRRWSLWPVDGQGSKSWSYCEATVRGHICVVRADHRYQHRSVTGFRWAA